MLIFIEKEVSRGVCVNTKNDDNFCVFIILLLTSIRGGITQCSKRFVNANNQYMDDEHNLDKATSYLLYLDMNDLYGLAIA